MSSKNRGTDQLRGYSRGGLHISFRTYKKGFTISLSSLGGGGEDACIYSDIAADWRSG